MAVHVRGVRVEGVRHPKDRNDQIDNRNMYSIHLTLHTKSELVTRIAWT